MQNLVNQASADLYKAVVEWNFEVVELILDSEYPVGTPVTTTGMDVFSLACSLPDFTAE